jgi:uncharacterized protein (TIGR02147 family)
MPLAQMVVVARRKDDFIAPRRNPDSRPMRFRPRSPATLSIGERSPNDETEEVRGVATPKRNNVIDRLFEYDSYRLFLQDFIAEEKVNRPGFSQRSFAMRFGLRSSGSMSLILSGSRNMSETTLQKLPEVVGLTGRPATFLLALVRFNQAQDIDTRESTFAELKRIRKGGRFAKTHSKQFPYWEEWHHVVVRELAVHGEWNGDLAKLGGLVRPAISSEKAKRSLERLCEMGLLRLEPDGTYAKLDPVVSAEGAPGAMLREFKREMVLRSLQAMDDLPPSKRHFSSSTISMTRASFRALCERIDALRAEFLQAANEEEPELVIQANFQVFPVSQECRILTSV